MAVMRARPASCLWSLAIAGTENIRGVKPRRNIHWLQREIECDSLVTLHARPLKRTGRPPFSSNRRNNTKSWWPTPVDAATVGGPLISRACYLMGARKARAEVRRLMANIALMLHCSKLCRRKASDSQFFDSFGRHGVTAVSSHPRGSAAVTLTKGLFPSVNQSHPSATNESGVFAGVGRERHRWGASCIAHAHWRPLPPRSCVLRLQFVGDEALAILREVFVHLWRHTVEVAFPQLAPPGPAFVSAMRLLA
jgi:hypothetical protein